MRQAYDYWQDQPGNYFNLKSLRLEQLRATQSLLANSVKCKLSVLGVIRYRVQGISALYAVEDSIPNTTLAWVSPMSTKNRNTLSPELTNFESLPLV